MPKLSVNRGGWPFRNPPNTQFRLNKASPQAKGLVGWWPPLGSKGNVLRDYARTIHGSLTSVGTADDAVFDVNGEKGRVVYLDYDDAQNASYVNCGDADHFDITGDITLAAWVYDLGSADYSGIVGKWAGAMANRSYKLNINADQQPTFLTSNGIVASSISSGFASPLNQWYHLVGVQRGINRFLYLNGEQVATDANAYTMPVTATPLSIGILRLDSVNVFGWDGYVADTRLYNRGFTDGEALRQYHNPWELYAPEIPLFQSVSVPTGDVAVTPTVASAIAAAIDPTVALGSATYAPVFAGAIASVSAPDVELGSLVVTPGVADAIADVIDPGVIEGSMTITPVTADAIVDVVVPDVVLGSMTATPVFASVIADTVDPDVELSSLIVTPVVADAIADVVDPTASQDSLSLTPGVADAIADTVNPTVELGAMTITPVFASSIVDVVDPNVIGGDTSVTPVFAGAIVSTIAPVVLFGSVAITPVFASAIARVVNPTVIGGIGLGLESKLDISIGTIL